MGEVHFAEHRLAQADESFSGSLSTARSIGDDRVEAMSLHSAGRIALERHDWTQALTRFEASLDLFGRVGDRRWIAKNHLGLGEVTGVLGDQMSASGHWEIARSIFQDLRAPEISEAEERLHRLGEPQ